jgi:hypothetical protein
MADIFMIGGLFETSLLLLWWIGRVRTSRQHSRQSSALQREIDRLRHALAEVAMERHQSQDSPRRRRA